MKPVVLFASWGLTLLSLGGLYAQHRRLNQLETRLTAVRNSRAADAADEVAGLTARVGRLERIVSFRPALPAAVATAPTAAAPTAPVPGDVKQLREDVDALLTGEALATDQGKARLRAIIAEDQRQQWNERQSRRDERLLQQLSDSAHLSSQQHDDLNKALEAERTQRAELLAKARSGGGNMQDVRPALQALRTQTDQKAREILNADQFNQYNTSRAPGRGRGGGGTGGGGEGGPAQ